MIKIALIGAGSTVFMKNIVGDVLHNPLLKNCTIALMDIDPERLQTSQLVAEKIAQTLNVSPRIEATTDRRKALTDADFVITMFQIAGYRPGTVIDFEIPKKYGLRQTIADTLGIGGIMRGLRTVPVFLELAADIGEVCPNALLLQYVNPMAINCWALARLAPQLRVVGLCHSVQGTAEQLAHDLGETIDTIHYRCAGINHMAFYTCFEKRLSDGSCEDLYPRLTALAETGKVPPDNRVRYEVLRRFGYFVTESSEHFAEYVPWFIKRDRPDLIEQFNIPLDEYPRRCEEQIANWDAQAKALQENPTLEVECSNEYAALIIDAVIANKPQVIYGNVPNRDLISNLPADCCVEVPCLVDANGVQPTQIGALAPQLTALMQTNINVQALTVEALVTGKREHVYHAAMLDPHTAAELSADQIYALVDELLAAHSDWLPPLS